ncbi:type II toxin-antitoxin system CcdA family antitoxin [Sphingobium sp. CECT 9361]|uniref:type II toxin-antitoxin system CcdA family antitoxin n=1 Tax=Sphingobium sp. CECT 9361 TaxID=2845384 RepID=UPI001E61F933|nr:type II toxin-antitoxin system CcdA family antitoxin [Sphingobium sp. CECT 9361]
MNAIDSLPIGPRKAANLSLDVRLVSEARALGINISRACEVGLAQAIAATRAEKWQADNAEALASSNLYVEERGIPLAHHRQF